METLRSCLDEGVGYDDRTKVGRHGVWQSVLRVDLTQGQIPLLQTKTVQHRWIFEELMWFLHGSTYEPHLRLQTYRGVRAEEDLRRHISIWKEWATKEQTAKFGREKGELGPVYGHLWRNFGATKQHPEHPVAGITQNNIPRDEQHPVDAYWCKDTHRWINDSYAPDGVDQIARVITTMREQPFGTRHIVSGWDPKECDNVALPPCHTMFHFKVWPDENGKPAYLSSELYQRSCDCFLGVPYNVASYSFLTYILADLLGLKPLEFVHILGDVHVYSNHHDAVKEQLDRWDNPKIKVPYPPTIKLKAQEALPEDATTYDYVERLLSYTTDSYTIEGYEPLGKIKAPVAV